MASETNSLLPPLPRIPQLLDHSNLDHWNDMLYTTLAHYGLEDHVHYHYKGRCTRRHIDQKLQQYTITIDILKTLQLRAESENSRAGFEENLEQHIQWRKAEVTKLLADNGASDIWKREQAAVKLLIKGSLAKIRGRLVEAGWHPDIDGAGCTTAKHHYDFVLNAVSNMTESSDRESAGYHDFKYDDEVTALCALNRKDYGSMDAYQLEIDRVYTRLVKQEHLDFPWEAVAITAIDGMASYGEADTELTQLEKQLGVESFTWEDFKKSLSTIKCQDKPEIDQNVEEEVGQEGVRKNVENGVQKSVQKGVQKDTQKDNQEDGQEQEDEDMESDSTTSESDGL